jgi:hypothetical protein
MDFQTILATDPILNPRSHCPYCKEKTLLTRRYTMHCENPECGVQEPYVPVMDLFEIPSGSLGNEEDVDALDYPSEE